MAGTGAAECVQAGWKPRVTVSPILLDRVVLLVPPLSTPPLATILCMAARGFGIPSNLSTPLSHCFPHAGHAPRSDVPARIIGSTPASGEGGGCGPGVARG